jgi:hypothetical protein
MLRPAKAGVAPSCRACSAPRPRAERRRHRPSPCHSRIMTTGSGSLAFNAAINCQGDAKRGVALAVNPLVASNGGDFRTGGQTRPAAVARPPRSSWPPPAPSSPAFCVDRNPSSARTRPSPARTRTADERVSRQWDFVARRGVHLSRPCRPFFAGMKMATTHRLPIGW